MGEGGLYVNTDHSYRVHFKFKFVENEIGRIINKKGQLGARVSSVHTKTTLPLLQDFPSGRIIHHVYIILDNLM